MIVTRTKTYAVCPACHADAGCVDHLLGKMLETLWYCAACGQQYRLSFTADGQVEITIASGRKVTTIDLLVLKPQDKPVYFVVEGMRFEGEHCDDPSRDEGESKQFFYDEHSCPTNWFEPVMVYFDGDSDPHGLIEFVDWRDESAFPEDESHGPNDRDRAFVDFIEQSAVSKARR